MESKTIIQLSVAALLLAGSFFSGWFTRDWYDDSIQLQVEKAAAAGREASARASAEAIAKIPALTTKVIATVVKNPDYQTCKHDEATWATIQEAFK